MASSGQRPAVLLNIPWGTEQSLPRGSVGGGGKEWEFGTSRGKLLHTGWINNKVLLCSTRNYIQYPVTNHNGKEYEEEYTYIYIYI